MPRLLRSSTLGRKGTCERDAYAIRGALEALVLHSRRNQGRRTGIAFVPLTARPVKRRRSTAAKKAVKRTGVAKKARKAAGKKRRRMTGGACSSCPTC